MYIHIFLHVYIDKYRYMYIYIYYYNILRKTSKQKEVISLMGEDEEIGHSHAE